MNSLNSNLGNKNNLNLSNTNNSNNSSNSNSFLGELDNMSMVILAAAGFVLLVFIILISSIYYKTYKQNQIKDHSETEILPYIHDCRNNPKIIFGTKIPASTLGNEYSLNFWIYINGIDYRYNDIKHIITKGKVGNVKDNLYPQSNPSIYLDRKSNTLKFSFALIGSTDTSTDSLLGCYNTLDVLQGDIKLEKFKALPKQHSFFESDKIKKWKFIDTRIVGTIEDLNLKAYGAVAGGTDFSKILEDQKDKIGFDTGTINTRLKGILDAIKEHGTEDDNIFEPASIFLSKKSDMISKNDFENHYNQFKIINDVSNPSTKKAAVFHTNGTSVDSRFKETSATPGDKQVLDSTTPVNFANLNSIAYSNIYPSKGKHKPDIFYFENAKIKDKNNYYYIYTYDASNKKQYLSVRCVLKKKANNNETWDDKIKANFGLKSYFEFIKDDVTTVNIKKKDNIKTLLHMLLKKEKWTANSATPKYLGTANPTYTLYKVPVEIDIKHIPDTSGSTGKTPFNNYNIYDTTNQNYNLTVDKCRSILKNDEKKITGTYDYFGMYGNDATNSLKTTNYCYSIPQPQPGNESIFSYLDSQQTSITKVDQTAETCKKDVNSDVELGNNSKMFIHKVDAASKSMSISINNLPLQRWISINLQVHNNVIDIFMDGLLYKTHIIPKGTPMANEDNIILGQSGGFDGYLSNIIWANKALHPGHIYNIYKRGPRISLTATDKIKKMFGFGPEEPKKNEERE